MDEGRLRQLAVDMLASVDENSLHKVTLPYNEQITAMTMTAIGCLAMGNLLAAKACFERVFYEGYVAGQQTRATDFDPSKWKTAPEP